MRLFALASWVLTAAPLVYALLIWANLPSAYSENVGYRFFHAMRLLHGVQDDFIHPGQGVLLPIIQAPYYMVATFTSGDLFNQIMIFAHLTLVIPTLLTLGMLLWIAVDKVVPTVVRALLIAVPAALSVTHEHLYAYHLYPDYIGYEKLMLLFAFYFYIRRFVYATANWRDLAWLGVMAGLTAALKINMGIFVLALAFLHSGFWIAIVCSALTYAGLTLAYYRSTDFSQRYLEELLATAQSWSSTTDWSLFNPLASWGQHNFANLTALLAMLGIGCAVQWRKQRYAWLCAALAALAVYMLVRRGAGTSYFDAVVVVTLLIVLVCAVAPKPRLVWPIVVVATVGSVAWIATHLNSYTTLKENLPGMAAGPWQKGLYEWNRSHGLPIVGVFPSNSVVTGTIEDMMLRGFANFAKPWSESNDNPSRKQLFPDYGIWPGAKIPSRAVLVWVTSDKPFPLADRETLDKHNAQIKALLAGRTVGPCYSVAHPIYGPEIRSCVVGS